MRRRRRNNASKNLVSYHKESAFLVGLPQRQSTPISLSGCSAIVTEIIEQDAGTMADHDNNRRRRLVEFKDGCRYGKFGKTKAYELIAHERIRAYKMGGKTMIDLDSVDEYHASLPRVESRAS
jgi:excisionase family DNA binding protein